MPPASEIPADTALILLLDRLGLSDLAEALRAASAFEALTPLSMFAHADVLVQGVMLGLLAASVLAWAIWAGKLAQLSLAQRHLGRDYRALAARGSLGADLPKGMLARMQAAAQAEIRASEGLPDAGIKERVAIELVRIEAGAARAMQAGVSSPASSGRVRSWSMTPTRSRRVPDRGAGRVSPARAALARSARSSSGWCFPRGCHRSASSARTNPAPR